MDFDKMWYYVTFIQFLEVTCFLQIGQ